jgi:hypothetical protein
MGRPFVVALDERELDDFVEEHGESETIVLDGRD